MLGIGDEGSVRPGGRFGRVGQRSRVKAWMSFVLRVFSPIVALGGSGVSEMVQRTVSAAKGWSPEQALPGGAAGRCVGWRLSPIHGDVWVWCVDPEWFGAVMEDLYGPLGGQLAHRYTVRFNRMVGRLLSSEFG